MKRVLAAGVFDFFHAGHLTFLEQAAKLGSELIVLVTCDQVAASEGKKPRFRAGQRAKLLKRLGLADQIIIGRSDGDMVKTVEQIKPDVIALGYDQKLPKSVRQLLAKQGWRGKIVRLAKFSNASQNY